MNKKIAIVMIVAAAAPFASAQTHTGHTADAGVHCDHFSNTGDTVCYDRESGRQLTPYSGYSGQKGYQNNPSTSSIPNRGTIPSGTYNITGSAPFLNGRAHSNSIQLQPQAGTNTYGRDNFRVHGDNSTGTASDGCIIAGRTTRSEIAERGASGTLTVRPTYPQSYNYGRTTQMPYQYVPPAPRTMQSYRR